MKQIYEKFMSLFEGIVTIDNEGQAKSVEILHGNAQDAKEYVFKDADKYLNDLELFCHCLRLPMIAFDFQENLDCTISVFSEYKEQEDQIVGQVLHKIQENKFKLTSTVNGNNLPKLWQFNCNFDTR